MQKISLPIEETGFFWLPDEHDTRVPGILKISESGKVTLETTIQSHTASLSVFDDPRFSANLVPFKRILGMTESGPVTLENCSTIGSSWNRRSTLTKKIIQGDIAFMGEEYGKDREITFSAFDFFIEGLDEWLGIPVGTTKHELQGNRSTSIIYSPPKPIIVPLPEEGMKLSLSFSFSTSLGFNYKETKITQSAFATLESEELRPLDDFLEVINKLHRFLCFATERKVPMTPITGYSWEVTQKTGQHEKEIPIRIFYEGMSTFNDNLKVVYHDMLFTYKDVRDQLDTIINRWLTNYKEFEQAFNLYFTFREGTGTYVEWQFLSLMLGIETLHRMSSQETAIPQDEFDNLKDNLLEVVPEPYKQHMKNKLKHDYELTLRQRMKKMVKPFQHLYNEEKPQKKGKKPPWREFVGNSVDKRNELVHVDNETKIDYPELLALSSKLDALFQLHLLKLCGVDESAINDLAKKRVLARKIKDSPDNYQPPSFMDG